MVGDVFIFVERDFPTSEKNYLNLRIVFGMLIFKKLTILLRFVFYCNYFIDKLPCLFIDKLKFVFCCNYFIDKLPMQGKRR